MSDQIEVTVKRAALLDSIRAAHPTVNELKAYAATLGADLGELRLKEEIVNRIADHMDAERIQTLIDSERAAGNMPPAAQEPDPLATSNAPYPPTSEDFQLPGGNDPLVDPDVRHFSRLIIPDVAAPLNHINPNWMTGAQTEAYIRSVYLERGYVPEHFDYMGQGSAQDIRGHQIAIQFQRTKGKTASDIKFKLGPIAAGMSAFQADAWLHSMTVEGWNIVFFKVVAVEEGVINCLWVLTR